MKLPHAPASIMALFVLAATVALPAPARAQTYDPSYPVCLQVYQGITDYYFECRYQNMAQCAASASAARRNAWSIRITVDRKPSAASVKSGLSRIEGRSISPPGIPPAAYAHLSPAIAAERERPRGRRFRGLRRVGPQAAPGCFDLGFAGALAAGPLLGGGRAVFCHIVAHDRT